MPSVIRKRAAMVGVALVTSLIGAGAGPALAHGGHARFAHKADKVDGLHAVKSNVAKKKRRGKLVATSSKTGRLLNNIIKKAPNANKLDGLDSSVFVKNTDPIDADTFDGLASSAFVKTTDDIDADTLDGQDSSDFLGAGAKAADSDLLDGMNSTAFLGASAKAADANLLDGFDSTEFVKTTDTIDADTLDGKNSTDFVERAGMGFILVQGDPSGWKSTAGSGTMTTSQNFDQTTFTSTSSTGNSTHFVVPNLPVAAYGRKLQVAGIEFCYDAGTTHAVDQIRYERTVNSNGSTVTTSQILDATDRTDEACRYYGVSNGDVGGDVTVAAVVESTWTDTGAVLRLGRVTFMLEPTAADATPLS